MQDDVEKKQEMFMMPLLKERVALDVIAHLSEQTGHIAPIGLKARFHRGWIRFLLPAVRGSDAKKNRAFHKALKHALQDVGDLKEISRAADQASPVSSEGLIDAEEAAVLLVADCASDAPPIDLPEEILIVFPESAADNPITAAVLRQGRDVRVLCGNQGLVATYLSDAAVDYGTVSDLLGRSDLPAGLVAMRRYTAGSCALWLPLDHAVPDATALSSLGRILESLDKDNQTPDRGLLASGTDARIVLHLAQPELADPISTTTKDTSPPVQPLDLQIMKLKSDQVAAEHLTAAIINNGHRIGYRVQLQDVPPDAAAGMDVEELQDEIEKLELRIARIRALGAPQMKLLRFSGTQLPALVDALRRLPPKALTDGSLRYAAGHSAGLEEPAHYLYFDSASTYVRLPEILWYSATETSPITYWLEPHVAEAQMHRATRTRVFVPDNTMLAPSLAHFGGDVDGTLKLVLGNLFFELEDFFNDEKCHPWILFTDHCKEPGKLRVETVNGAQFAPVKQQIGWINSYLEIHGPKFVDREKLKILAEELYDGAYVQAFRADMARVVESVSTEWDEAVNEVRGLATRLLDEHAKELNQVANRLAKAHAYLAAAGREMESLEMLAGTAEDILHQRSSLAHAMEGQFAAIRAAGETFEDCVNHEIKLGEDRISTAEARLERLRDRANSLLRSRP